MDQRQPAPLRSVRRRESSHRIEEDHMAQATAVSPQALTKIAQGLITAYNDRDWNRAKTAMTADFVYDEVATGRKVTGADQTIELWKGWAQALPDSKGTFEGSHVANDGSVTLEVTWRGTHKGTMQMPNGSIPATGKPVEMRACAVFEIAGERASTQRHYFDMATLLRQIGHAG
jgi:steroid delta-isomerase-like uncharacterized protein